MSTSIGRIFDGFDQKPISRSSSSDPSANLSVSELSQVDNELNEQFKNVGFYETVKLQSNGGSDLKAVESYEEEEEEEEDKNENVYPVRNGVEDCSFYMRTGSCKYGLTCRFNHPIRRIIQIGRDNKVRAKEEDVDKLKLMDCKYYFRTGGCKYGESCNFNHSNPKTYTTSLPKLNFLGLPIRLGEIECSYYMQTGSCKFGSACKFNHPDPMSIGETNSPSFHGNGGSIGSFQGNSSSWSSPRHANPNMLSQSRGVSSDWNGYQASEFPSSTYLVYNSSTETSIFSKYQYQLRTEEFPERPDQPECSYYLKTGDCKFKYTCKYHHPKNRLPKQPPFALNDKGLPLRPDQRICTHYSRYGICKFGPACRFDHSNQTYSVINSQAMEPPQVSTNGNESDGWN